MFTWPCKTNFTTVPDPLELQILLEDQTATEILFQSYAATTTIDRMTWLACISHYVRGQVHKTGHNYVHTLIILTRKSSPDLTLFIRPYEEQERELHDAFYLAPASKNLMNMARYFNHHRTNVNDRLSAAALISFSLFKVQRLFRSDAYSRTVLISTTGITLREI